MYRDPGITNLFCSRHFYFSQISDLTEIGLSMKQIEKIFEENVCAIHV
jgi:hypothetical protein